MAGRAKQPTLAVHLVFADTKTVYPHLGTRVAQGRCSTFVVTAPSASKAQSACTRTLDLSLQRLNASNLQPPPCPASASVSAARYRAATVRAVERGDEPALSNCRGAEVCAASRRWRNAVDAPLSEPRGGRGVVASISESTRDARHQAIHVRDVKAPSGPVLSIVGRNQLSAEARNSPAVRRARGGS